jgi:uncharacterized protein
MTAILDTSFLFVLTAQNDRNHASVLAVAQTLNEPLVLPTVVLPEICYLLTSRLGHRAMRQFIASLTISTTQLEPLSAVDLVRSREILEQYADSQLDFTDTAIIAIAERRGITRILTLDRRDFSLIRPKHCNYFELLP